MKYFILFLSITLSLFSFTAAAEPAIDCRDKARKDNQPVPTTCLALAKEAAKNSAEKELYQHLKHAVEAGFGNTKLLKEDPLFAAFQNKPEFANLVQQAQRNLTPCAFSDEFRSFDFWIGEWTVTQNGQLAGDSSIQLILDQCVIYENWTGRGGYNGKSFNVYNPADKKWHQLWVDNAAGILHLQGESVKDGIDYRGETLQADGSKLQERLTFRRLQDGKVSQVWEQSPDGGKTWNQVFNGIYERKR